MIDAADDFDPTDYPHGIVCEWCDVPLVTGNAMRLDVTIPKDAWGEPEGPRVYTYACVSCVVTNRVAGEP